MHPIFPEVYSRQDFLQPEMRIHATNENSFGYLFAHQHLLQLNHYYYCYQSYICLLCFAVSICW